MTWLGQALGALLCEYISTFHASEAAARGGPTATGQRYCTVVVTTLNAYQNDKINLKVWTGFASKSKNKIMPLTKSHRNQATERMWATVIHRTNEEFYLIKCELSLPEGITTPFTNIWFQLCVNSFMDF